MELNKEQKLIMDLAHSIANSSYYDSPIKNDGIFDFEDIDWDMFIKYMVKHKLVSMYYDLIKSNVPKSVMEELTVIKNERVNRTQLYIQELGKLCETFEELGYSLILIKGLALSKMIYGNAFEREFNDLDIFALGVYDIASLSKLKNLLIDNYEYQQLHGPMRLSDKLDEMGIFHEYVIAPPLELSNDNIFVELKLSSSAIKANHIKDFLAWDNLRTMNIEGIDVLTSDTTHTLLHLFANIYGDTEKRLGVERKNLIRDLIDITIFINKYTEIIDWQQVKLYAEKYEIAHKVYNVLLRLNSMDFKLKNVTQEIIQMFKPSTKDMRVFGINEIGAKTAWEQFSTPMDRIFAVKGRNQEYTKLMYLKNTTIDNPNYVNHTNALPVEKMLPEQWQIVSEKVFGDEMMYGFAYDSRSNSLMIKLRTTTRFSNNSPFLLSFSFYTGLRPCFVYIDFLSNGPRWFVSTPEDRSKNISEFELQKHDCLFDIKSDGTIIVDIPFDLNLLSIPLKEGFICYNVVAHKYTSNTTKLIMDVKYCEPFDPEEWYDNMGVIKLF